MSTQPTTMIEHDTMHPGNTDAGDTTPRGSGRRDVLARRGEPQRRLPLQGAARSDRPSRDEMARAFLASDASYDGVFWTGVRTTGIFCRPSCPAKKPRPENTEYFASTGDALRGGYRACKRCEPLATQAEPPEWVAALLAAVERDPEARWTSAELHAAGVEPARARRWFLRHHGVTFAAYCRSRRLQHALSKLRAGASIDDVALGHGFASHSGFRDAFGRAFKAPPGKARDADCVVTATMESPIGTLLLGARRDGACLVEFSDRRMLATQLATLSRTLRTSVAPGRNETLDALQRELEEYFAGKRREFGVPIVAPGTPFQESVWAELRRIPYGETISYADLARRIGRPGAQRAVGHANGLNRVAIVIPCHRVVNAGGAMGGYGGGLWRKRLLLDLERRTAGSSLG